MPLQAIYEDDYLLVKTFRNQCSRLCMISFTGVGHAMGGLDLQKEEFIGSSQRLGHLFVVTDKTRSWANSINVKLLQTLFMEFGSFDKVIAIGNSMGGTNALLLGPLLGANIVIAFTPQFSVHPSIFPNLLNPKWQEYRDSIQKWRFYAVDDAFVSDVSEYIFHGDHPLELVHAQRFAQRGNRHHFILSRSGHDIAARIKASGCLYPLIDFCIDERREDEIIELLRFHGISCRKDMTFSKYQLLVYCLVLFKDYSRRILNKMLQFVASLISFGESF